MYNIFVIQQGSDDKNYWNRCGVAFKNKDGSLNLKLDLFPGVQFQVREKSDAAEPAQEATNGRNANRR